MSASDSRTAARRTVVDTEPEPGAPVPGRGGPRAGVLRRVLGGELLFANAAALVFNTGAVSVLGFLFWVIAARYHAPAAVGAASALISMLLLLTSIAQVDLANVLARFMPVAGRRAGQFLVSSYGIAATFAAIISAVVLIPLQTRVAWFPEGDHQILLLTATVIAVCIFDLQDGALIGLRAAVWIPVENVTIGVVRVALVAVMGALVLDEGIFVAWMLPMALSIIPVNLLLVRPLLSKHAATAAPPTTSFSVRTIARFTAGDYVGDLLLMGVRYVMPLLITAQLGVEANGYFYVTWLIGLTFDGALIAVGASLTAEGAHDPARLPELARGLARRVALVGLPVIALIVVAAPVVLTIVGAGYATEATGLLRLLALAFIPRALILLWAALARVERQVSRIVAVQAALAICTVGLSLPLIGRLGITGAGWAYLVSQMIVAAVLLPKMTFLFRLRPRGAGHR